MKMDIFALSQLVVFSMEELPHESDCVGMYVHYVPLQIPRTLVTGLACFADVLLYFWVCFHVVDQI